MSWDFGMTETDLCAGCQCKPAKLVFCHVCGSDYCARCMTVVERATLVIREFSGDRAYETVCYGCAEMLTEDAA